MLTLIGWGVRSTPCYRSDTSKTPVIISKVQVAGYTMLSRRSVGTYEGNDLTRNASGNARPQSSQLAEPL